MSLRKPRTGAELMVKLTGGLLAIAVAAIVAALLTGYGTVGQILKPGSTP